MRHSLSVVPQFFVTAQQPCPYLANKMERKLFTPLYGENAQTLNDTLSKQGFRRSQNVLYRPSCTDCVGCLSARISVERFLASRTQRRIMRKAQQIGITRTITSPWATDEQYDLFRRYLDSRHANGGMADMDIFEFSSMIEETPIKSRVVEYTLPKTAPNTPSSLIAACLTDVFDDGLSMVYSFYDPNIAKMSLGSYMVLDHVNIAKDADLPYVYLGYWVPGSKNMGYKAGFSGLEIYKDNRWQDIGEESRHSAEPQTPLEEEAISDKISKIRLPTFLRHP